MKRRPGMSLSLHMVSAVILALIFLQPAQAAAAADSMAFLSPSPTGNALLDIWTPPGESSPTYMVGEGGTILRYGTDFEIMTSPTHLSLRGIHGTAANDIWAVGGSRYGYEVTDPERSVILHYDGASWSAVTPPADMYGQYLVLEDVWADGAGTVYAVNVSNGFIAKKTGSGSWNYIDTGLGLIFGLQSVHGFAEDDVYVAGQCGMIIHWDGAAWSVERSENPEYCSGGFTSDFLYSIWGPDEDNVFATGNGGKILKRDPETSMWITLYPGGDWTSDYDKYAISGTSPTDMYFVGMGGEIKQWDDYSFTTLPSAGVSDGQYSIGRIPGSSQFLIGMETGSVMELENQARTAISIPPVVDRHWGFVQRTDKTWLSQAELNTDTPIFTWNGTILNSLVPGFTNQMSVTMLRAHSNDDVVISGFALGGGPSQTRRFNGSSWVQDPEVGFSALLDEVKSGVTTARIIAGIWDNDMETYLGSGCVGAVCTTDNIYHKLTVGTDGEIYAVGKSGQIARFSQNQWTDGSYHQAHFYDVAAGNGQVCAAGTSKTIICMDDGGPWAEVDGLTSIDDNRFVGIAYTGGTTFVAALNTGNDGSSDFIDANRGTLYKIDNKVASLLVGGISVSPGMVVPMFADIASNGAGEAAAVGANGIIYGNEMKIRGDVDGSGTTDLEDLIMVLQILSGDPAVSPDMNGDVDGNEIIEMVEAIWLLNELAPAP